MSRYRTAVGWSAGLLATAAAAVLTASATLPGSAAHLEVDGGVLQVFVLDGPDDLPGPPGGVPPGPPDGVAPGPPEGIPGGPPVGVPGGSSAITGPPADHFEQPPTGSQDPSDRPSDEQQKPDMRADNPSEGPSDEPEKGDSSPSGHSNEQPQSEQDSKDQVGTEAARTSEPPSASTSEVLYENCAEAREADAAPLESDDPGYRTELDDDGDGRACEKGEG